MELILQKSEFVVLSIPDANFKLYDGSGLLKRFLRSAGLCEPHDGYRFLGAYEIRIATSYLKPSNGSLLNGQLTQAQVMEALDKGRLGRAPTLREDMVAREVYEQDHKIFNDDFGRENSTWCGYMADKTKRHKGRNTISGADGQPLIVRDLYYSYPHKDKPDEIGPIVMTGRPGMVPRLTTGELEKRKIKLKRLEQLGVQIPSDPNEIVDVRSPLGYPLLVFDELLIDKHGEHFHPPQKDAEETAVIRRTCKHNEQMCFRIDAAQSYTFRYLDLTVRPVRKLSTSR